MMLPMSREISAQQLWRLSLSMVAMLCIGCRRTPQVGAVARSPAATQAAASQPAIVGGGTFRNDALDIQLTYPTGWIPKPDPDCIWNVVPLADTTAVSMSLQIPSLPPHLPGMIPVRMVKNGYVDDLRDAHGSIATTESSPTIPKASAKLVHATWTEKGTPMFQSALILVHADHVYILRSEGKASDEAAIKPAFESVSQSLRWIK
jgi:hypothetical protein